MVQQKIDAQEVELQSLRSQIDTVRQEKEELLQIAQKDNRNASEIKQQLEVQVLENEKLRASIEDLEKKLAESQELSVEPVVEADN